MIASVRGTVRSVRLDAAVVEVSGVGMLVHATPTTLATQRTGAEAELATRLVVREDSLTLDGFARLDARAGLEILPTGPGNAAGLPVRMSSVACPDRPGARG